MSDAKNSPLPWADPRFSCAPYSIWKGNTQIASCRWVDDNGNVDSACVQDEHEAQANAALIVRAVNAHADLIAALEALLAVEETKLAALEKRSYAIGIVTVRQRVNQARAALKKAKGE